MARRISIDLLKLLFSYDPENGVLTRIKSSRSDMLGVVVSRTETWIEGIKIPVSHVAFALGSGRWPEQLVDHKDGDHNNIRKNNLREATHTQNQFNKVPSGQFSKGVVFKKDAGRSKPWSARIRINGRKVVLGAFATEAEAADAYRRAAEKVQGEFALHNSMKEPS